jgi:hypothetical protein
MPNWKKVIVSGSSAALTTVTATAGFTGSLSGSATSATSASYALTASYVNTLNQNVLITGTAAIGTSSLGPNENTLTLGARDAANEGGQLGLNAPGGTYTSASFIDVWQNFVRILRGSNAGSDGLVTQWNLHTKQMQLPAYTAASSFPGTATANLAVDSGGNIITVSTAGGSVFPYVGNAVITGSLTTTGIIYAQPNGGMYFQGGDDAALYDVNIVNTMGIYGVQDVTVGAIKLGSNGTVLYGSGSKLGVNTTNPSSASFTVNGNVWANSFTGSLQGTASYATQALSASWAPGGGNAFPYTGSAEITGSLTVTGSFSVNNGTNVKLDTATSTLTDDSNISSVDWQNRISYDTTQLQSIDWTNRYLYDSATTPSIQWSSRALTDSVGNSSLDWDVNSYNGKSIFFSYNLKIINDNIQEKFSDVASLGFNYEGEAINGTLDVSVAQFDLIYLETDGIWYQTTQATADCSKLLGICIDVGRQIILLEGSLTVTSDNSLTDSPYVQSIDHGLPIYIRDSSGTQMSTVQPTATGQYVRILGHAYYNNITDSNYWTMKFRPANDWYTI